MRVLIILLLLVGIFACCCRVRPVSIEPTSQENRLIDSCEVFLRKLQANMVPVKKDGDFYYAIRGEWAKRSRKNPRLFNVEADFIEYKNCIIGLTPKQLRGILGEPTSISMGYNTYFYIRRDTSSIHTPAMYRGGDV